jgi:hypothetical protein
MYSSVNARVGDVIVYLVKRGVLQNGVGNRGIRQRDRMAALAVKTPQDLNPTTSPGAVV